MNEHYELSNDVDVRYIYPKGKDGKTRRIMLCTYSLSLKDKRSGVSVVFKHYKHQSRWLWGDSRERSHVSRESVQESIAKMLFRGDKNEADALMRVMLG